MQPFQDQAVYPTAELYLLRNFMQELQIAPKAWLLGTGLIPEQIEDPATLVSFHQFDIIYRNIYRLVKQPDLGMVLGKSLNLSRWGILATALQSSRNVAAALNTAKKYRALVRSRFLLQEEVKGDVCIITVSKVNLMSFPVSAEFSHEVLIGTVQRLISDLLETPFCFKEIRLNYPEPKNSKYYTQLFGCPVIFNQTKSQLVIPIKQLAKPLPLSNKISKKIALSYCDNELLKIKNAWQHDMPSLVNRELNRLSPKQWNLETVAEQLEMSARTLRRKLKERDTNFRYIKQQHQLNSATALLELNNDDIPSVASQCGFDDINSFRLQFKALTGITPSAYRRQFNR